MRHFHPHVLIASVPNGVHCSKREAARLKREGLLPNYPDLIIDEPRGPWRGLRIEMKRGDGTGRKRTGQIEMREKLLDRGYLAEFCVGHESAIRLIEEYLALPAPDPCPMV